MTPKVSIVCSTHDRLPLFRRTLWALADRPPSCPFEVVFVDDGSTEDVLGEIKLFSSRFHWKFVKVDMQVFEKETGVNRWANNPSLTTNIGFRQAKADLVFVLGNEVLPFADCFDQMLLACSAISSPHLLAFSTTYDVPKHILQSLDQYGTNLSPRVVDLCRRWPLASPHFHTDVTNYVCLMSKALIEKVGGYDERFLKGIGKEDSDFVRRCRAIPGWTDAECMRRTDAISLHQSHGGRTFWSEQDQSQISNSRWKEGERLSKAVWDLWDGSFENRQPWPWGEVGIVDVVANH